MRGSSFMVAAAVLATACGTKDDAHDDRGSDSGTELVCNPGTRWEPGQAAFREVTSEWGLDGVVGIRLAVTDINGDGWADLLVRNGGGPDDFSDGESGPALCSSIPPRAPSRM